MAPIIALITFFTLLLFLFITQVAPQLQPQLEAGANFSCQAISASPCDAYISYITHNPGFTSITNISDLFGVSQDLIVKLSNLESKETKLVPGQLLLVPIKCSCNGTRYLSNITYEIKKGGNYYDLAIGALENLTDWHLVPDMNPSLIPTQLKPGDKVIFPLSCKCPSMDDFDQGINYFITYVWKRGDQVTAVANKFHASPVDITTVNNLHNLSSAVASPVLIPVPRLPILSQPIPPKLVQPLSKSNHRLILIVSGCVVVLIVLLVSLLVYYNYIYGSHLPWIGKKTTESSLETSNNLIQIKGFEDKGVIPGISVYLGKPTMFNYEMIMEATMHLDDSFKVGRWVYKAVIDDRILVLKRIKDDENDEEMKILQRVNHANLVQLVGFSWNKTDEKNRGIFLVYEYVEKGSLNKWLYGTLSGSSSRPPVTLTWSQRLKIALDVANGLQYLHEHAQPSIFHGDIRTKNILLDSGFKAKISNFSMARHAMGPEELKSDVFGFGVVVLELVSGKKAMGMKQNGEFGMTWKYMGGMLESDDGREERLRKWMDPHLEGVFPIQGAVSLVTLANACLSEKPAARPSMAEIVFNLSVLMHSGSEVSDKSWASGVEMEDQVIQIVSPIKAR